MIKTDYANSGWLNLKANVKANLRHGCFVWYFHQIHIKSYQKVTFPPWISQTHEYMQKTKKGLYAVPTRLLCHWIKPTEIWILTSPPVPIPDVERKINLNSYFHTSLWCLKRFYETFKAFIKPFEESQRSVKIEI